MIRVVVGARRSCNQANDGDLAQCVNAGPAALCNKDRPDPGVSYCVDAAIIGNERNVARGQRGFMLRDTVARLYSQGYARR